MSVTDLIDPATSPLLTDLYELNMVHAYLEAGMTETATFEFFIRKLPAERNFFLACGLEQVLTFLENARFGEAECAWLESSGRFSKATIDRLKGFRFRGEVEAMPEGTVFFANEPILRVKAPLPEAQFIETRLINILHFQCLIASKAARMVLAEPDKVLLDFGLRRAHGAEAGVMAARAAYAAGFHASATIPAEPHFGVPIAGTMAHSFIQAHDDESAAFEHFARARPDQVVLLIDTYDTEEAARKVTRLAPRLAADGIEVKGVRLDSGDLADHARKVRAILDEAGLQAVKIYASGGLDEWELARFRRMGAPIDGYGIGTSLTTSNDHASLDCAYKLQTYAGRPRRKLSEGKATWPGEKQVFRRFDADGAMAGDTIAHIDETFGGTPLLEPMMRDGRRLAAAPSLDAIRARARSELAHLPPGLRGLKTDHSYPVEVSPGLEAMAEKAARLALHAAAS